MLLQRQRLLAQVVELVAAVLGRGDAATVEQRAHGRHGLIHPRQPLTCATAKVDAVPIVLVLEPRSTETEDRPAIADVIERRDQLGHLCRIAERIGADEQPELRPTGDLGPRAERQPALEDRLLRLAKDRVQMVPRPEMLVAQLIDLARRALE